MHVYAILLFNIVNSIRIITKIINKHINYTLICKTYVVTVSSHTPDDQVHLQIVQQVYKRDT